MVDCGSGVNSMLIEQQMGDAYQNVKIVADNITALLALVAGNDINPNVLTLVRGTTSLTANGVVDIDEDNTYFLVYPEVGLVDNITTFSGGPNGRVIIVRPAAANQTLTLKPVVTIAITGITIVTNELIATNHGLSLAQEITLTGSLPGVANGTYYAVPTGANTFKISSTKAFALAGTIIDLYENGVGQLHIGNISISADIVISGLQTLILIKDDNLYYVLSSAATGGGSVGDLQQQLSDLENSLTNALAAIDTKQDYDVILAYLSTLNITGNANKVLVVNASSNGFAFVASSTFAGAHTHLIADVTGLSTALAGKSDTTHVHSGYALTSHNHDAVYQKKATVSTANPSGGVNGDIWFKVV